MNESNISRDHIALEAMKIILDKSIKQRITPVPRIDQAAAKVQGFANAHRTLFLVIVFTFVIGAFVWNAYRLVTVYRHSPVSRTATEKQDSVLRERHKLLQEVEIREHKNRGDKP